MTTINYEPDSYCLLLAQSTSPKPDKCCLRLLRSTYYGSHPWCVVLIITSIRTCSNLFEQFGQFEQFELFEQVRTCPNFTCQVRTGSITSVHIPSANHTKSSEILNKDRLFKNFVVRIFIKFTCYTMPHRHILGPKNCRMTYKEKE